MFLADGSAVYDRLGKWFTLLVLEDVDTSPIEAAAARRGVPLQVVRIDDDKVRQVYERRLFLFAPTTTLPGAATSCRISPGWGAWRAPDAITNHDVLLDRILGGQASSDRWPVKRGAPAAVRCGKLSGAAQSLR